VIRPWFRAGATADLKSDDSPVTIADREAEAAMRAVLSTRFPDHAILGEEGGEERQGARYRWVLDPIDGTRAFITGRPTFGTLVALLDGDVPVLGLIDQPITGERWLGVADRPTVFRGGFGQAGCRPCAGLSQAELSCTSPAIFRADEQARWERLAQSVRRVSWGGDCYAYGLLALGQIDIVAEATLKLWDWAALVPVITGAGGSITDWAGRPLHPDSDGTVLALGDPALLPAALQALETAACA
jgi:histidinol phosphatase-like enzyme (inositol monophosphatase family)